MHLMDVAGAIAASRHSNCPVVTVYVDSISFQRPVRVGFVALDEEGKPTPVPRLITETEDEIRGVEEAKARREERLRKKKSSAPCM